MSALAAFVLRLAWAALWCSRAHYVMRRDAGSVLADAADEYDP